VRRLAFFGALVFAALGLVAPARGADRETSKAPAPDAELLLQLDLLREMNLAKERQLYSKMPMFDRMRMLEQLDTLDAQQDATPARREGGK
jgi:hypothetical protein